MELPPTGGAGAPLLPALHGTASSPEAMRARTRPARAADGAGRAVHEHRLALGQFQPLGQALPRRQRRQRHLARRVGLGHRAADRPAVADLAARTVPPADAVASRW